MKPARIDTSDLPTRPFVPLNVAKHTHLRTPAKGYESMLPRMPIPPRWFVGIGEK